MLKVLSGFLKSMKLKVPKQGTRPTSVLLKRRVFDQYIDWEELAFIDLCSGTGSMAIEALSRGCPDVIAIESHFQAHAVLKENTSLALNRLQKMEQQGKLSIFKSKFLELNSRLQSRYSSKDLILFFDPPYEDHQLYLNFLEKFQWVGPNSQIWVESDSLKGLKELEIIERCAFRHRKTFQQGSRFIVCFTGEKK